MKTIMFDTLGDNNFSVYSIRDLDIEVKDEDIEDLFEKIKNMSVDFATIDLGYMNLREFNQTHLAEVLNKFEIPFFSIELPYYVKGHYASQISEIQHKYNELKNTYNSLKNTNSPGAQELKYLIDYYSKELIELNNHIDQNIRIESIVKKILSVLKDRDSKNITFMHFGEENTFVEIMKQLKYRNVKSNIIFFQISKFIN
ncbi:MAG: hypothetical protein ACFFBP_23410 [Promethearchaeota archaeon]